MTYKEWFESQQGIAYDSMWSFARAAWGEQEKTIEELRAKLAEAERDAKRYRAADKDWASKDVSLLIYHIKDRTHFDADLVSQMLKFAIDASKAMKEQP